MAIDVFWKQMRVKISIFAKKKLLLIFATMEGDTECIWGFYGEKGGSAENPLKAVQGQSPSKLKLHSSLTGSKKAL